jgi:phosphoenolpyruvate-protein kinase (PTS system EI component)
MPQARRSTRSASRSGARSSSRSGASFKEPAALKRLNKSLEAAQKALAEMRAHAGSTAAKNTQTIYKGLGKFVTDARRDTGKFTTALKKDFDQARKMAERAGRSTSTSTSTARRTTGTKTTRRTTRRPAAKRTTRKSS